MTPEQSVWVDAYLGISGEPTRTDLHAALFSGLDDRPELRLRRQYDGRAD